MELKTVQTFIESFIDKESGELLDVSIKKTQIVLDKEKFSLVYASFWDAVTESDLSKSDIELFGYLLSNYGEGTIFSITNTIKQIIAKKSGKNISSYNKSTRALIDAGFILEISKKNYVINPIYAYEGSSMNRKKAILELHQQSVL